MTTKKIGMQTAALANPPTLASWANVVGKKEGEGPLADTFDYIDGDDTFGESTWEKSESAMQKQALGLALNKAGQAAASLDWIFAGDLLNQCIGSSFAARGQDVPFFGLYGACSTMGEGLALAAMTLDGGFGEWAGVVVSSHFCTAERQYRTPLEYGGQHPSGPPPPRVRPFSPGRGRDPILPMSRWARLQTRGSPTPTTWARPWLQQPSRPSKPTSATRAAPPAATI